MAVALALLLAAAQAGKGHMERFGEHMPPRSLVWEVDAAELRQRAAAGERTLLDPGHFMDECVVKHRAVIFRGLARDWAFREHIRSDDWLLEQLGSVSTRVETKDDDKLKVPPNMPFSEFLKAHQRGDNLYMVDETPPVLHKHIPLPEPLRCSKMSSKFFVTYFWMSTGETDSKMHIDTDENIMCVLHGTKRVLLVDPKDSEDVYADSSYAIGVSPVDTRRVNHTAHPRAAHVPYDLAEVRAGDCFFLPQNYWHYVHSFGPRNQAITMWWKSKPVVRRDRFNSTLTNLSFAQTLANYEQYVQTVAPISPSVRDACWADAAEAGAALGLGSGDEAARRYLTDPEYPHMSDFEFATDKEDGASFGEDTKGDRDEADWVNPDQQLLGLPESLAHCHFNLTNARNPCFVAGCVARDDIFGCLRYALEYCKAVPDYGCQDLVWTLNKKSGQEYEIITKTLPNVFELDREAWPRLALAAEARGDHLDGQPSRDGSGLGLAVESAEPEEEEEFVEDEDEEDEEEEGSDAEGEDEDEDEIGMWKAEDDESKGLPRGPGVVRLPPGQAPVRNQALVEQFLTADGESHPFPPIEDSEFSAGLTAQDRHDHRALLRWLASRGKLLQSPPSRLSRRIFADLQGADPARGLSPAATGASP
ncbi:hypothetical protein FNF27_05911 [Cafeteria roenbergensis]|uniref:JmjC domain-containing protein n=4 Tax=Cafeteria roenbergensis TaxID=33653 RepID=A0A5A8E4C1_CAFRO|nr:hypothetical protein FNF27_05911 [Cafeteria roenbergensis]